MISPDLVEETHEIYPQNLPEGSKCIGSEITYRLKHTPARLSATKYIRYKYLLATPDGDPGLKSNILIPSLPDSIIKNCLADTSLLATLVVEKYVDHLPAYRQLTRFLRAGIQISYSTMLDWITRACKLLTPIYELLRKETLKSDYLMMDETTMRVMDKDKKGKTHRGYFWTVQSPVSNLVFFEYHPGRGQEIPKKILQRYRGYLQSDGYIGYQNLQDNQNIRLMCCMAHARRYFSDSISNDPQRAEHAMDVFGKLYTIERQIKDDAAQERLLARQEQAKPIWREFGRWLQQEIPMLNEKSAIYKAFAYTMARFRKLSVYMEDPKLNIDNNPIEASIRSVAMGRNNFLFCGSHPAAQRSAMLYSFMASCKLHQINPTDWLTDVLAKVSNCDGNELKQLLPQNWKKNQNNIRPIQKIRIKKNNAHIAS